jgi:UDP-glucose-4-epimerase GalE
MQLKDKSILVVGGAGYIGAHVCKAIADAGGTPITFDNLGAGYKHAVKYGPLVEVDLRDRAATLKACADHKNAHAVVHLASSIEVGLGERDPAGFYTNNVVGALNLLDGMQAAGLDRLIFSSTCATYGEDHAMPLRESSIQNPVSVYGKTKLAIEHMIQSYHRAYGLRYVTLRYFNASGADPSGEIGEEHDPETHLIPIAMQVAAGKRERMKIFGTDYPTPDGTCVRDYIHVNDIAAAHLNSLTAFDDGLTTAELNIGTGEGLSNLQILETIKRVTGRDLPWDPAPRREGDLSQLYADAAHARDTIGFEAKHSDIENIISTAWNFHRRVWGLISDRDN